MKTTTLLSIITAFVFLNVTSQNACSTMFNDGVEALELKNYRWAILKLQAASKCNPELANKANTKILLAFDKIQELSRRAEQDKYTAERNLENITTLINDITELLQRDENTAIIGLEPLKNDIFKVILPYQDLIKKGSSDPENEWKVAKSQFQMAISMQNMNIKGYDNLFKSAFETSFNSTKKYQKLNKPIPDDLLITLLNTASYYGWHLMFENDLDNAKKVLIPASELINISENEPSKILYPYAKFQNALHRFYKKNENYTEAYSFLNKAIKNLELIVENNTDNLVYASTLSKYQKSLYSLKSNIKLTKKDLDYISAGCELAKTIRETNGSGTLSLSTMVDCVLENSYQVSESNSYTSSNAIKDLIEELNVQIRLNPLNPNLYLYRARLNCRLYHINIEKGYKSLPYKYLTEAKDDWVKGVEKNASIGNQLWEIENVYWSISNLYSSNRLSKEKDIQEMEDVLLRTLKNNDNYTFKIIAADIFQKKGDYLKEQKANNDSILKNYNLSIGYFKKSKILNSNSYSSTLSTYAGALYDKTVLNYNRKLTDSVLKNLEEIEKLFRPVSEKYPFDFYIRQYFSLCNMLAGDLLFNEKKYAQAKPYLEYASHWGRKYSTSQLAKIYKEGLINKEKNLTKADSLESLASRQIRRTIEVECDYVTHKRTVEITIMENPKDFKYKGIDDYVERYKRLGGTISKETATLFRQIQEEAWEKNMSFAELCAKYKYKYSKNKKFESSKFELKNLLKVDSISTNHKMLKFNDFISNFKNDWKSKTSDEEHKEFREIVYDYVEFLGTKKRFSESVSAIKRLNEIFPKEPQVYRVWAKAELAEYENAKSKKKNIDYKNYLSLTKELGGLGVYYRYFLKQRNKKAALHWQSFVLRANKTSEVKFIMFQNQLENRFMLFDELYLTKDTLSLKKDISYFLSKISKEKTNSKNKVYYKYLVQLDNHLISLSPNKETQKTTANHYNSLAWYQLLTGEFKNCEKTIKKGLKLDSNNLYFYTNLPATFLLQGKYKKALKSYGEWKDKPFAVNDDYETFKDVFLDDIKTFKQENIIPKNLETDVENIIKFLET